MKELEQRLRDAFEADARTIGPGKVRPFAPPGSPGQSPGRQDRRDGGRPGTQRLPWLRRRGDNGPRGKLALPLAAAGAVALVAVGSAVVVPRFWPGPPASHHTPAGAPIRPLGAFLTVTTTGPVIHGGYLVRYGTSTLQLRSVRHGGQVIATLLHSLGTIDAVMTRERSVVAVESFGCRSRVLRIDPRTDRVQVIRTLRESAQGIALSPDGRRLAYLTYPTPQPCSPARQPGAPLRFQPNPGGPAQFLPSVLAVVDLASGETVRSATSNPGMPPWDPAWSPDGSQLAVVRSGSIDLLSAARPDFRTARALRPPRGCGYVAMTWTVTGLRAVLGCGKQDPALSPRSVVGLSATGQRTGSWRLPACIDGVGLRADPTARHVLVQADIGYGNGPGCGSARLGGWTIRVAEVRPGRLATIAVFPQRGHLLEVTGW